MRSIPVIDIFAGPGGLSEGFAALRDSRGNRCFDIRLSIEKDKVAHSTLELRAFVRSFACPPDSYYDYLQGALRRETLLSDPRFRKNAEAAKREAWWHTLSEISHATVVGRVREAIGSASAWILIGGPPCQAYSVVGRSRMRSAAPRRFEKDERHFLYREYLRILAEHEPPVFVMENVKGLLSSTVRGQRIFEQIISDLSRPNGGNLRYRIVAFGGDCPSDFVVRSEQFGIPQSRHRVILCGIREDLSGELEQFDPTEPACIEHAIGDLPPLRSRISRQPDSHMAWLEILESAARRAARFGKPFADVAEIMSANARRARRIKDTGSRYMHLDGKSGSYDGPTKLLRTWYLDRRLPGVTGHEARAHMPSDLQRYLFAASFAQARGHSPKLRHFPTYLLPAHCNARRAHAPFQDRFRVQVYGKPATTVVSHIAKDGHYFIHPDSSQCRSLTLREAARLQTFPDNYYFEGTRTEQFVQVGNAVPPLLAHRIAKAIYGLFSNARPKPSLPSRAEAARELEKI